MKARKFIKSEEILNIPELSLRHALKNPEIAKYRKNLKRIQIAYKELQQQQEAASSSG